MTKVIRIAGAELWEAYRKLGSDEFKDIGIVEGRYDAVTKTRWNKIHNNIVTSFHKAGTGYNATYEFTHNVMV